MSECDCEKCQERAIEQQEAVLRDLLQAEKDLRKMIQRLESTLADTRLECNVLAGALRRLASEAPLANPLVPGDTESVARIAFARRILRGIDRDPGKGSSSAAD